MRSALARLSHPDKLDRPPPRAFYKLTKILVMSALSHGPRRLHPPHPPLHYLRGPTLAVYPRSRPFVCIYTQCFRPVKAVPVCTPHPDIPFFPFQRLFRPTDSPSSSFLIFFVEIRLTSFVPYLCPTFVELSLVLLSTTYYLNPVPRLTGHGPQFFPPPPSCAPSTKPSFSIYKVLVHSDHSQPFPYPFSCPKCRSLKVAMT